MDDAIKVRLESATGELLFNGIVRPDQGLQEVALWRGRPFVLVDAAAGLYREAKTCGVLSPLHLLGDAKRDGGPSLGA